VSVMRCECDRYIDTDFDCEGVWEDGGQHRYWCGLCVESAIESGETAETNEVLAAFQRQSPTEYAEVITDRDIPAEPLPRPTARPIPNTP
jgi:hypothetical protein